MQKAFSFINIFNSSLHISGDKFAHLQEQFFLTVYTVFGTMHRNCCRPVPRGAGLQQCRCIVPKAVYTVNKCSWRWANLSPETCRAELKRLINENVVASCWLLTSVMSSCNLNWCFTQVFHSTLYSDWLRFAFFSDWMVLGRFLTL